MRTRPQIMKQSAAAKARENLNGENSSRPPDWHSYFWHTTQLRLEDVDHEQAPSTKRAILLQQFLLEKVDGGQEEVVYVFLFSKTVAFVFSHQIPGCALVIADGFDHLLRFGYRHARVVLTLDYQQRLVDLVDVGGRRNAGQML